MSLICGANGLFPCPICLVPKDQLMMIWREFEKWTGAKALQLLAESRAASTLKNAEQILKNWSLHPVDVCVFLCQTKTNAYPFLNQNAFLELGYTDPYEALSFDRLHAFHGGLFGHHIWPLLKAHIETLSAAEVAQVDAQ